MLSLEDRANPAYAIITAAVQMVVAAEHYKLTGELPAYAKTPTPTPTPTATETSKS